MSMKSHSLWESTKVWCQANPDKQAAIVTPQGTFTIIFKPK